MGRYSETPYSVNPLTFSVTFKPKNNETKQYLNTIHNQITFTIQKLNLIVERRVKSVNKFRNLDLEHDELIHQKTFENKDTKIQEDELQSRYSPVLRSIVIDTEIYFLYVKILLDSFNDFIYYYEEGLPSNPKHSFSKPYYHIIKNGCNNRHLQRLFQNELKWYPLMVQIPRNKLLVHDNTTAGMTWNDHGVDISIGKSGWNYKSEDDLKKLMKIVENHKEHFSLSDHSGYIHSILRELIRKPEVFDHDEIEIIVEVSSRYPVFPYVAEVQPKLQKFLDFMQSMVQIFSVEGYW